MENVENIGGHYARTLRLWKENFLGNFEERIRPALTREHPDMTKEGVEVFRKKWEVSVLSVFFGKSRSGVLTGPVLFYLLRSRFCDQNFGRRYYHCWAGRDFSVHG